MNVLLSVLENVSVSQRKKCANSDFPFYRSPVAAIKTEGETVVGVNLQNGQWVDCQALLWWPQQHQTELINSLPLQLDEVGNLAVDGEFRTSLPGVYAAGDITYTDHQSVPTAIAQGSRATATMIFDLAQAGLGWA